RPQAGPRPDAEHAFNVPEVGYPLPSGSRVNVLLPRHTCQALLEHCRQSNRHGREVGGFLLGYRHEPHRAPGGPRDYQVVVTDILPVTSAAASGAHVKLDHDAWDHLEEQCQARFGPEKKERLGWYHTPPTQGIFFSGQDLDAHTVFTQPH